MKKRFSALLLAMLILLSLALPASAAGLTTLTVSSGTVKAGESVELTVSIENNPGLAAALVYFYYDTEAFTLDVSRDLTAAGGFDSSGSVLGNTITAAKQNGVYRGQTNADGALILWYNQSGQNTTADGEMFKIRLTAQKDAANGTHTIQLGYSSVDTGSSDGTLVPLQTGQGTITVSGGSDDKQPANPTVTAEVPQFTDISGHWAENWIRQAAGLGLVEGYQGKYRPNDTMTRAELVTILWRAEGEPAPKGKASFRDLTQNWYLEAVAWAEENNVVNGMGDGLFAPNASVTREQLVTILHRLAGSPSGMELMLTSVYDSQYPDSGQIGSWAKSALYWSVYKGIYCGENAADVGGRLAPKVNANRAQIAVMMVRYLNKMSESEGTP